MNGSSQEKPVRNYSMPKPYHGKKNKIKFLANSSQIILDALGIGHNTKKPPMRHALRAPK